MHNSYHISGMTDEDVIRSQAIRRFNDGKYPDETTIHYHPHAEKCRGVESNDQRHMVINQDAMDAMEEKRHSG